MRIVSHTCSNTEIVCALGCAEFLVGVDEDSDFPVEVVAELPQLGRDLSLDVAAVRALKPDLVLTSLTLPGHEKIVAALEEAGLKTLVCAPLRLADVYADIRRIAAALNVPERGEQLVKQMQDAMPPISPAYRPRIHVEWWPKPVIVPAKDSWVTDLIALAGGLNPYAVHATKSVQVSPEMAHEIQPDAIVMSWCGVEEKNYRADVVLRREGWNGVKAIDEQRVVPITEAFLGRPGPRLTLGYKELRKIFDGIAHHDNEPKQNNLKITLDHNCIIDLEKRNAEGQHIKKIIERNNHQCFVVNIGASEMRERGIRPDKYEKFEELLISAEIEHLGRLNPAMILDVTFWDRCVWADEDTISLLIEIEKILFGDAEKIDIAAETLDSPAGKKWLNRLCDIHTMWCHIQNKNDVFLTNDNNFMKATKLPKLLALGARRICKPSDFYVTL